MNDQQNTSALSVTELNRYIKLLVSRDEVLSAVSLRGEISNFKAHSSGHYYFTLKDEGAEIAAVMFRADAARMSFRPADGMRVLVYGSVDVYERSGRVQVYVRTMLSDGVGALALAYERLKKKLAAEGLFDEAKKLPLPRFPDCVGVITAPTGAAIRDILNVTGRRYPQAKILLYPSLVQGPDAPASLVAGVNYLNATSACDVIILGRGGGSMEDLWAFNDENLVRAVAASEIPVISAVGHETDFTLCDFVADRRAPTPSAAAELAVPDRAALLERVSESGARLDRRAVAILADRRAAVARQERALSLLSPDQKLLRLRQTLSHRRETMDRVILRRVEGARARFSESASRLEALSPLAVLGRGFAALKNEEGRILPSAEGLTVGQRVTVLLRDGSADARIEGIELAEKE